jgi:hypothetical protein
MENIFLEVCKSKKNFEIMSKKCSAEECKYISDALKINQTIEILELVRTSMDDECIEKLQEGLKENHSLIFWNFAQNQIGNLGKKIKFIKLITNGVHLNYLI